MDKFVTDHIQPLPGIPREKIRIAVIDSGVEKDDPVIKPDLRDGQIQECRNFSSQDPNQWDDKVGHGTMVTRLLMRVAPNAELYIAKVTSDTEYGIPKNKLYCIAEVSKLGPKELIIYFLLSNQITLLTHCTAWKRLSTGLFRNGMSTSSPCLWHSKKSIPTLMRLSAVP